METCKSRLYLSNIRTGCQSSQVSMYNGFEQCVVSMRCLSAGDFAELSGAQEFRTYRRRVQTHEYRWVNLAELQPGVVDCEEAGIFAAVAVQRAIVLWGFARGSRSSRRRFNCFKRGPAAAGTSGE